MEGHDNLMKNLTFVTTTVLVNDSLKLPVHNGTGTMTNLLWVPGKNAYPC